LLLKNAVKLVFCDMSMKIYVSSNYNFFYFIERKKKNNNKENNENYICIINVKTI